MSLEVKYFVELAMDLKMQRHHTRTDYERDVYSTHFLFLKLTHLVVRISIQWANKECRTSGLNQISYQNSHLNENYRWCICTLKLKEHSHMKLSDTLQMDYNYMKYKRKKFPTNAKWPLKLATDIQVCPKHQAHCNKWISKQCFCLIYSFV